MDGSDVKQNPANTPLGIRLERIGRNPPISEFRTDTNGTGLWLTWDGTLGAGVVRSALERFAEDAMGTAVLITREDLDAAGLRRAATGTREADTVWRMLALALVLDGRTRGEAAELCGMDRQTLRD